MAKQHSAKDELTTKIDQLHIQLLGMDESLHILLETVSQAAGVAKRRPVEDAALQNERLRLAVEVTGLGTWDYDALTGKAAWSDNTRTILGVGPEAEAGYQQWLARVHPEDRQRMQEIAQRAADPSGHGEYRDEYRIIRPDGSVRWVQSNGKAFFEEINGERRLTRFIGTVTDITDRRRTEEAVRASQEMLRLVMDNIPQHIFWKDRNSVYLGCNSNFAEDAGVGDPAGVVGKTDYDLPWRKEEADFFREYDRRVMENDTPIFHIIEPLLKADGKEAWLDTNKIPLHDAQGNVVGILGTYEDITERKLLEIEKEDARKALQHVYERERRIAETLQRSFLPEKTPELDGYRLAQAYLPALSEAAIGGDVYDLFRLPSGKVAMAIADVSGKGLRAARHGAMVKYSLRAHSYRTEDPAEIMSNLNASATMDLDIDDFVTCFFGVLDPDTGRLDYANAGHNEPLHIPCSTRTPVRLGVTGPVLGLEEPSRYTSDSVTLCEGDLLLLYTDGVTDARGVEAPMGTEGLERHLSANRPPSAEALVECVLAEVRRRSGDRLADDVAMLALEVVKQPPRWEVAQS